MRRTVAIIFGWAVLSCRPAMAQDLVPPLPPAPSVPAHAETAEGFAPRGFEVAQQASGDLNLDGRPDLALVLAGHDPALVISDPATLSRLDSNPRLLVVALANPQGGYDLAARADDLIPRQMDVNAFDYLEDGGVSILQGVVRLSLQIWAGAGPQTWKAYDFYWRDGRLRLVAYSVTVFNRASGESDTLDVNFLTGLAERRIGNDFDDTPERVARRRMARRPLLPVEAIGDGINFSPRIPVMPEPAAPRRQGRGG